MRAVPLLCAMHEVAGERSAKPQGLSCGNETYSQDCHVKAVSPKVATVACWPGRHDSIIFASHQMES